MSPRTGRPVIGKPKNKYLSVRTDEDMIKKIEECSSATGKTKVEIVREGIDLIWEKIMGRKK